MRDKGWLGRVVAFLTVTTPQTRSTRTDEPAPHEEQQDFASHPPRQKILTVSIGNRAARCAAAVLSLVLSGVVVAQSTNYVPMVPGRLLDTRSGGATVDGQFSGTGAIASGSTLNLTVVGRDGIPSSGVGAVAITITAVAPSAAGYLTVWAAGAGQPFASNLNLAAGAVVSNQVIVPVGANGQITIYGYVGVGGSVDVLADVAGYFPTASNLTSLTSARLLDTRSGGTTIDGQFAGVGAVAAGATLNLTVLGRGGVPASGVSAVIVNVTATNPTAPDYITAWPTGASQPFASNLNMIAGQTIANLVVVAPGSSGQVSLFSDAGTTDLIVDVVGYFSNTTTEAPVVSARLLDTRPGNPTVDGQYSGQGTLAAGSTLNLTVLGRGGVPSTGVGAVALNVTSVSSSGPGYVTAWGNGETTGNNPPLASQLNYATGQTIGTLVIAQVGTSGQVLLYNGAAATNLIADVVGYFPISNNGGIPLPPTQISASANSSRVLAVNWTVAASGPSPTYLQFQRATSASGPWTLINSDYTPATSGTLNNSINAYATYYYEVAACNAAGCSLYTASSGTTVSSQGPSIYGYDANSRLTAVQTGAAAEGYQYDPLGNLRSITSVASNLTLPSQPINSAPSITSFTPQSGGASTSVTLVGVHFLPVSSQTLVLLGNTVITPSTLNDTQITFLVPSNQGSAPITVVTPYGEASTGTFLVPPTGVTLASTVPLTMTGDAQTLTLTSTNSFGAYLFSAQVGAWVSLQLSSLTTTPASATVSYTVYGPNNQTIATGTVSSSALSVHLPPIPSTGDYLVVFASGSVNSLSLRGTLSTDPVLAYGSSGNFSVALAGQSQRVMFTGTIGLPVTVADVSVTSVSSSGQSLSVQALAPNAITSIVSSAAPAGSGFALYGSAATTGNIGGALVFSSSGTVSGTVQILLDSTSKTATVNGSATSISTTLPGQAAIVSFTISSPQSIAEGITSISFSPVEYATQGMSMFLFDSSGRNAGSAYCALPASSGAACSVDSGASYGLAADTYTLVFLPPTGNQIFTANVVLSSDLAANLSTNTTTAVSLSKPGQSEKLTFPVQAGNAMLLNVLNISAASTMYAQFSCNESGSGYGSQDSSTSNGMLFFIQGQSTGTCQLTLTSAAAGESSSVFSGSGTGGTGSAQIYLDNTAVAPTINGANDSPPASSAISAPAGRGRLLKFTTTQNIDSINLQLSAISVASGQISISEFAPNPNGGYQRAPANSNGNWTALCSAGAGPCTSAGLDTYLYPLGSFYLVVSAFGSENASQPSVNLPHPSGSSFSATATLICGNCGF